LNKWRNKLKLRFTGHRTEAEIYRLTRASVYTAVLISFLFFFRADFSGWLALMPISAWTPVGVTNWIYPLVTVLKSPSTAWLSHLVSAAFLLSTAACIFGWQWRIASITTLVLSLVVFGLKNSFGHAFRSESVLILAQFLLIFGPGGRDGKSAIDARASLQLLRLLWVSMFFLSALNKLRFSGWAWASDNFLHDYLLANQITRAGVLADRPFADLAHTLIATPTATMAIGYFVLLFELLYPIVFLKRFKVPVLLGTVAFQLSTFVLLGVNFLFYLPLLPIWLTEKDNS
jgi:hypothetical protein